MPKQTQSQFQNYTAKTLADHTARLINIEKNQDRLIDHVLPRVGKMEQNFSFFKGVTYFLCGMLGVFVSLLAIIK